MGRRTRERAEITELRAMVRAQAERIEQLEQRMAAPPPAPVSEADAPVEGRQAVADGAVPAPRSSRRALLRHGAVALGAGAAGVVASATPAAAANGDPVLAGQTNTATATTVISNSTGGASNLFLVRDSAITGSFYQSAIGAYATGTAVRNGVYVYLDSRTDGSSSTGHGIVSYATLNARSNLLLTGTRSQDPTEDAYVHRVGEVVANGGRLWYCTETGTPGTWARLDTPAGPNLLAAPERGFDSRSGRAPNNSNPAPKGKFGVGETRTIDLNAETSVPATAAALLVNVTVANTVGAGYLTIFDADLGTVPTASTLNWPMANFQVANTTVVACSSTQAVKVFTSNSTHVVLDVVGWFPG